MSVENKHINGDAAVSRNASMGGNARVQGNVHIGHDLRVDGRIECRDIKAANKGLFLDEAQLNAKYPHPEEGWFAGVGSSSPFVVYIARNDEWVRTNGTFAVDVDMSQYNGRIDELESQVAELAEIILSGGGGNVVNVRVTAEGHGGVTGGGLYPRGNSVTVKATAESGYHFVEWQDAEGNAIAGAGATYTFEATESVTLKAVFAVSYFNVTVGTDQGNLAEEVRKTDPQATINGYVYNEEVTVTAIPKQTVATAYFVRWEDGQGVVKSTSAEYTFNVTENVTLKAVFAEVAVISTSINPESGGTGDIDVTVTRGGVEVARTDVRIGDHVKITLTGTSQRPSKLEDGDNNSLPCNQDGDVWTYEFTYTGSESLTFNGTFNGEIVVEKYTIEVVPEPEEAGEVSIIIDGQTESKSQVAVEDGKQILLSATAYSGWECRGWWKGEAPIAGETVYGISVGPNTAGTYTAKFARNGEPDFYFGVFDTPTNNPVLDNINDDSELTKGWLTDNAKAQITLPTGKTFLVLYRSSVVPTACNITDDTGPGTLDLDSQQSFYAATKTLNNVAYTAREFYGGNTGSGNWSVEITFAANSNSQE